MDHFLYRDGQLYAEDVALADIAEIEARHLRMYRQFADRQVSLFQQLVQPIRSCRWGIPSPRDLDQMFPKLNSWSRIAKHCTIGSSQPGM